ncbi:MAG TPA: hypothetical protein VGD71_15455 [Kribbella sp.]
MGGVDGGHHYQLDSLRVEHLVVLGRQPNGGGCTAGGGQHPVVEGHPDRVQVAECHQLLITRLYDVQAELDERFRPDEQSGVLRDYGDQHNLLEMRGAGWEHVVASPNTERAWSMEMLAELAEASGTALPTAELRESAARIRDEVIKQLWDDEAGWFRSRYPDGHTELAYSVQAFDALRAGACPPEVAAALIKQIRPGAFLGDYGVSSVSAEDERHYEVGDRLVRRRRLYRRGPAARADSVGARRIRARPGRPAPGPVDG